MTDLFDMIAKGVFDPRASVRAVIALNPDGQTRIMMVLAAGFVQLSVIALSRVLGVGAAQQGMTGVTLYGVGLFSAVVTYVVTTALAHRIGAAFGGTGSRDAVATAVAWQNLLVAAIAPLFALGLTEGALGLAATLIGVALSLVYLGVAIAEAHGFRSTVAVIAVMLAVIGVIGLVSSFAIGFLHGMSGVAP